MVDLDRTPVQFEDFTLDPARGCLLRGGEALDLRPKSYALLRLFLTNPDRLLSKDVIAESVWPNVAATDESIARCVSDLRMALRDQDQRIIRTIPRRGYRFVAQITANLPAQVDQRARSAEASQRPSVVVLTFSHRANDSSETEAALLLNLEIVTELMHRRPAPQVFDHAQGALRPEYRDISRLAREHDVRFVVTGAICRDGAHRRVYAFLVHAPTGLHLWGERFASQLADGFHELTRIATVVADGVQAAIDESEQRRILEQPIETLGAWACYQRALWHMGRFVAVENDSARKLLRRAIALDDAFAPAYVAMGQSYIIDGTRFPARTMDETAALASELAVKAIAFDEEDPDAQMLLAVSETFAGRREEALDLASRIMTTGRSSNWANGVAGAILLSNGHAARGRELLSKARPGERRDPRRPLQLSQIATSYYFEGDYIATIAAAKRAIMLYPDHVTPYCWLAAAHAQQGYRTAAREALKRADRACSSGMRHYVEIGNRLWRAADYQHLLDGLRLAGFLL